MSTMLQPHSLELAATPPPTASAGAKRILFVDDEQELLDGLRDAMRPQRYRWTMKFVTSGEAALAALGEDPYDVVVSDLRMPAMDGARLLEQVRVLSPDTVRILLSGHTDLRVVVRAANVAHQLVAKPCDSDQLAEVIERACSVRESIARAGRGRAALRTSALPSAPRLYLELSDAISSDDATVQDITRIVEQDMAMAAKILQLANSAYYGRRQPVKSIGDGIVYLGLDAVRALALQAEAFRAFKLEQPIEHFDFDRVQRHCSDVGNLTRSLLAGSPLSDGAFTAALLHDVGLLILATDEPSTLEAVLRRAHESRRPLHEIEQELCGVTHAELGAHLLALWGIPLSVTNAVACHHRVPQGDAFDEAAATYVANILIEEATMAGQNGEFQAQLLDLDCLARLGVGDQLPRWRELAAAQVLRDERQSA